MDYLEIGGVAGVSAICLGTGRFGSEIGECAAFAILDRFHEAGGTFLDTAHIYGAWDRRGANGGCGNSETVIGRWLKERGCRGRMVIGTKGGHPDFDTGASCMNREAVLLHLAGSLRHLGTDHVDIYFLHRDDRTLPVAEILGWFTGPLEKGWIRALGCSNWRADRLAAAREAARATGLPVIAASQVAWSLAEANTKIETGKFGEMTAMDDAAREFHCATGLPVTAYNAQAGGFFAVFAGREEEAIRADVGGKAGLVRKFGNDVTFGRLRVARRLALERGVTPNQIGLAWLRRQPFPVVPIIGPGSVAHLDEGLAAMRVALASGEVEELSRAGAPA